MHITEETARKVSSIIYHFLASCLIVGGMVCITAASCQAPKPTGISVQEDPEGGTETCITWAKTKGCTCPSRDAGPGK